MNIDIEQILIRGAGVGLTPQQIYDMDLWEFNVYLKGYNERILMEQKNLIALAYYTGMFSNMAKKPKPLEHYLNKIEQAYRKEDYKDTPVDKELSRNIHERIQSLKGDVVDE